MNTEKTVEKEKHFDDDILRGITIFLAVGFILSMGIFWVALRLDLLWALVTGYATWAVIACGFPSIFKEMFFSVNANFGVVLADRLKMDPLASLEDQKNLKQIHSMRECRPGIHGKWPWEYVVACFDTRKKLLLGGTLKIPDKKKTGWQIEWQGFLTPLYGSLVNLARISEKSAQVFFQGEFEGALAREIRTCDGYEKQARMSEFSTWFKNLFGGPDSVHPIEKRHGMFTNTPQIVKMVADAEIQSSAQEKSEAVNDVEAAKVYAKELGISMFDAMKLVFARAGKSKMFDGLKNAIVEDK